jgi:hypothetical protein
MAKNTGARDISSAAETAANFGTTDRPTERASGVIAHRGETPAPEPVECAAPETKEQEAAAMLEYVGRIEKPTLENTYSRQVREGDAVVVPAGNYRNVINTSKTAPLKLYTLYSPPNHPDGTVHKTKADAEAAEAEDHR